MNKRILLILLLLLSISCNENQNSSSHRKLVERILKEDINYPSQYGNVLFFCKCQENKIVVLSIYDLRELFVKHKSNSRSKLLTDLFNQSIKVSCDGYDKRFSIDEDIRNLFHKDGLNKFIDSQCIRKGDKYFLIEKNITTVQQNTILYFLFVNDYISSFDDNLGEYIIYKIE